MTPNNFSFPSNRQTGHGDTTTMMHEDLLLCHPFQNARFESLDSSLPYFANAALNVPLAIATTVANLVVLLAIRHVTSIRLPSKLLLCSLVITDLGAGSVVAPQRAAFLFLRAIYPDIVQCSLYRSITVTGSAFTIASLSTLAAISLDRYAALFYHLKYQQIVTTRRVCAVLAFIWSLGLLLALTALWDTKLLHAVGTSVVTVALLVISVAYIKISRRLRAQIQPQAPDQAQQQAGNTLNMARYRRTASAMLMVFMLFLVCYLPLWCLAAVSLVVEWTALLECLWYFSYSLVLLNSLLNPFVYCLRLPEVRTEVVKQLRKLFCRSSSEDWNRGVFLKSCYPHGWSIWWGQTKLRIPKTLVSLTSIELFPVSGWTVNLGWHSKRIFNVSVQVIWCVHCC